MAQSAQEKIDDGAAGAGIFARHFHQRAGTAGSIGQHGEGPHFDVGAFEALESFPECFFVEGFRAVHVLDVNFKPADGIARCTHGV